MVISKPTIKDVARQAGVSIATVSRVMAKKSNTYTPQTEKKVLDAATELGYQKNKTAAELAKRSSDTIAVIINNPSRNFSAKLFDGMHDAALKNNHHLIIFYAGNHNQTLLHQAIDDAVASPRAGILLLGNDYDQTSLSTLKTAQLPVRLVNHYAYELPFQYISSNYASLTEQATHYLIEHGHIKIGLWGLDHSATGDQLRQGYLNAMHTHHLNIETNWIQYGDYNYQTGQQLVAHLPEFDVTAVVATSDLVAFGIAQQAKLNGIDIPNDLSLISINGSLLCDLALPPITSITPDDYQIGFNSVTDLLTNQLSEWVPAKLVERQSVKKRTNN